MTLKIDLSKIKITKIFKWLKSKNISDHEMLKTFNCGVGFCIIAPRRNIPQIKKYFSKKNLCLMRLAIFRKKKLNLNYQNH